MLSAQDREQVLRWSELQPGNRAGLVSNTEETLMEDGSSVKMDGTGIKARQAFGCFSLLGIMASSAQDVPGEQGRSVCREDARLPADTKTRVPTWH
jgi:hypothetical protein